MSIIRRIAPAAFACLVFTSASEAATFDFTSGFGTGLGHGDLVTSLDFGGGITATITATNGFGGSSQTGSVRAFDTTLSGTADPDLEGPFADALASLSPGPMRDFTTALIIQERDSNVVPDDERRGGTMTFALNKAINLTGVTFLDGEEGASVLIGGVTAGALAAGVSGDNEYADIAVSGGSGITSFTVRFNRSGALGGLTLASPVDPQAIPLPAGAWLLLGGLGAMGAVARRRRNA
jgi:hypothetical protein